MTDLTQIKCGGIVANLEGRNNTVLSDSVPSNTLFELNKRVRRLEATHCITAPPPSLEPTWDSLALRICRLKQKTDAFSPTRRIIDTSFASMVPDSLEISIETLQVMCADLIRGHTMNQLPVWPKCDDDQMLDVIRQSLCHAAGRSRVVVQSIPITRLEIYAQLIGLTLKLEENEVHRGIPGGRGPGVKACCGCCLCLCHNPLPPLRPQVINVGRRKNKFSWFKKLAFWRSSDNRSLSSRTSSTIVD